MRTAAYVHALNRIGDAIAAQGTYRFFTANDMLRNEQSRV